MKFWKRRTRRPVAVSSYSRLALLNNIRDARTARKQHEVQWFWNLAVVAGLAPSDAWVKWYRDSLEAGYALPFPPRAKRAT